MRNHMVVPHVNFFVRVVFTNLIINPASFRASLMIFKGVRCLHCHVHCSVSSSLITSIGGIEGLTGF